MFYIFHGDDSHSQTVTLASLQRQLGDPDMLVLNTTRIDGRKVTLSELQHVCDSVPFLSKRRLVIAADLLKNKPAYLDDLAAYLLRLPETTSLVFLESFVLPESHPILKLAQLNDKGYVKLHDRLRGHQLERWIRQRVKESGGQISNRAVHMLASNVGNNLVLQANEIEKLVLFKGTQEIQPEDVELLCSYVAEAGIFDLVDAIGKRDAKNAALLLHKKLHEGTDPRYLFSMIIRQFRLLIQVKEMVLAGSNRQEIAAKLKLHSYPAEKLNKQSSNYTIVQLEQIFNHLLAIDVGVKTGEADLVTGLNLFVAGVTI